LGGCGSSSNVAKIDRLFKKWDNSAMPGLVVGIVHEDSLIYSKGYGAANLERKIPNTANSIYYMCSLSKQFTAYSIVLLARQGKLKFDDDIHQYLPWMADFGRKITIRNLLNHTSGIRDDISLADESGLFSRKGSQGILTQQLALEMLRKEHALNFDPGEKWSYSNSNFVLLAEIVRVVSGQSFESFTRDSIFRPLRMTRSCFTGDSQQLARDRALSYRETNSGFVYQPQQVYTLGDGGLFTDLTDMVHWVSNFYNPRVGDKKDIDQLTEKGKLNNGTEINYAFGIVSNLSRGYRRFTHGGSLSGYRTSIAIYPDLKMGFIIFSNAGDDQIVRKMDQLAELFIPEK
jgi:CubicO group peptidase (beta-lactamase class C family)